MDSAAIGRALTRAAMAHPDWGTGSIGIMSIEVPGGDAWLSSKWHVWWALPALWRDDYSGPFGETIIAIVRPDVALQYVSEMQTLYTTERLGAADKRPRVEAPKGWSMPTLDGRLREFPLIRPRLPDTDWHLETVGQESYLGRPARRVRATRRAGSDAFRFGLSGFYSGVDEYECVFDDELQIPVNVTAIVDGLPAATISVAQVSVDKPIPTRTFEFFPPPGTRIAQVP